MLILILPAQKPGNRVAHQLDHYSGLTSKDPSPDSLRSLVEPFASRLESSIWGNTETLRHQVTHKQYRRGLYATTRRPPDPAPLAFPQQVDIEWGPGLAPIDEVVCIVVDFADATFREFCSNLSGLAQL